MFVSITRLRVRGWRFLPAFILLALRSARQARAAPGNVAVALLADSQRTFWTRTIWADEGAMRAFMRALPHRRAMSKLAAWCDEAAVGHWMQESAEAPSWSDACRPLQHEGRRSIVDHPTPAHTNFEIAAPRVGRLGELRLK